MFGVLNLKITMNDSTATATSVPSPLFAAIVEGDLPTAMSALQTALDSGEPAGRILENQLIPAMAEVGRLFECEEYFVPELLLSGRAMQEAMKRLNPLLTASGVAKIGRVVIGTVQGDLHDIGKNLVAALLEGAGFDVVDLGVDVAPAKFVAVAKEQKGTILALSALLTTTMTQMKQVVNQLVTEGIRNDVKVIVGGAPISDHFAKQIGADGYGENASAAVTLAKSFSR